MVRCVTSLLLLGAISCVAIQPASAILVSVVPVGNAGNANDPATGNLYGGVSYGYLIGTTEVTVGQYTSFLNAVAATDTYSLYNPLMATDLNIAGISRSGVSGSYSYGVLGSADHPVTYVSWGDAARFANWLHNGQPTGLQVATTTERGAYTLDGATDSVALNAVTRNAAAAWFIPSENEWYKAAYHQPAAQGGDTDNYWAYPTRSNNEPNSDNPPVALTIQANVANFNRDDGVANGYNGGYAVTDSTSYSSSQNYLTDAGAYTQSGSFYGTFDQGGNVYEWNEALISSLGGSFRGIRGGSWINISFNLLASPRFIENPTSENDVLGFRVATIPEPSAALLPSLACGVVWVLRKWLK